MFLSTKYKFHYNLERILEKNNPVQNKLKYKKIKNKK